MHTLSDSDLKQRIDKISVGVTGTDLKEMIDQCHGNIEVFEIALGLGKENGFALEAFVAEGHTFSHHFSEVILDTFALYQHGKEVFESDGKFRDWMESHVRALSSSRPIDLINSFAGRAWIRTILGRIEHGIFS